MGIISSNNTAESMWSAFKLNYTSFGNNGIECASESTIAAIKNGASQYKAKESILSEYTGVVIADAGRIRSLGQEFAHLDFKMAMGIKTM